MVEVTQCIKTNNKFMGNHHWDTEDMAGPTEVGETLKGAENTDQVNYLCKCITNNWFHIC